MATAQRTPVSEPPDRPMDSPWTRQGSWPRGIYNQQLLVKMPCSRVRGGSQLHQDRSQEPTTTAARMDQNAALGGYGGTAPGTGQNWRWDGWTRRAQRHPDLPAAQSGRGGRGRPNHAATPRLAEHR